jgi:hypothetical protein
MKWPQADVVRSSVKLKSKVGDTSISGRAQSRLQRETHYRNFGFVGRGECPPNWFWFETEKHVVKLAVQ